MSGETVGRPMEILLVEDGITSARLTMGALRNSGLHHRLTWLTDGEDALEFLHRQGKFSRAPRPDLILLDLGLPGCDGRDVLSRLRSDEDLKAIPVVVLTASTSEADKARSEELQVEAFMNKPVDMDAFLNVVHELKRFWHEDMILPGRSS